MEPYQERVIEEKKALDEKLGKLETFIFRSGGKWFDVPEDERLRMVRQYGCMMDYSRVLGERIDAFGKHKAEDTKMQVGGFDLDNLFTYHPPKDDQPERYVKIRAAAKDLARAILESCPSSAERTLAVRKVQEASMWANASIACNE